MIVVHNNPSPENVSPLINSTIVNSDGEKPADYKAYNVTSTVTWPDPAAYNESATGEVNNLRDARNDVVNHAKVPDIAIGTPSSKLLQYVDRTGEVNLLITSPFGNWRDYKTNGFCAISERVLLNPEELKMKNGVQYSLKPFKSLLSSSKVNGKSLEDILKDVSSWTNGVASAFSGQLNTSAAEKGEYISKFQNVPVVDVGEVKTSGLDSLTFSFKFGQAQLFSAEEEVVKPILALANIFMPRQSGYSNRITTPFMSEIRAKTHMVAACLGSLASGGFQDLLGTITAAPTGADVVENGASGLREAFSPDNIVDKVNQVTNKIFKGIDDAATNALDETVTILLNIGGYVTGPYVAESVNWDFDFNNVDEYGYPCSGSITFSGLRMIFVNCSDDVLKQWGYNIRGDNPFVESTLKNTTTTSFGNNGTLVGAPTGNKIS